MAVGLGSNRGDRLAHLRFGVAWISRYVRGVACSGVYETRPHEVPAQAPFLNACCVGRTREGPERLLSALQEAERRRGRPPPARRREGAPRALDLDLLLYGNLVRRSEGLSVPHPRMAARGFVLAPLAEVAPAWAHPVTGATVGELARAVGTEGMVRVGGAELLGTEADCGSPEGEEPTWR